MELEETTQDKMSTKTFLNQVWLYLRPSAGWCGVIFFTLLCQAAFALLTPAVYKIVFDDVLDSGEMAYLGWVFIGVGIAFLINIFAGLAQDFLIARVESRVIQDVRLRLFGHVQMMSSHFFANTEMGDVLNRFAKDAESLGSGLVRGLKAVVYNSLLILSCTALLFYIEWRLSLIMFFAFMIASVVPRYFGKYAARFEANTQQSTGKVLVDVKENLDAHAVVRSFGLEGKRRGLFERQLETHHAHHVKSVYYQALVERATDLGVTFIQFMAVGLGAYLAIQGLLSVGSLFGFIGLFFVVGRAMRHLTQGIPFLIQAKVGLQRVNAFLLEKPNVVDMDGSLRSSDFENEIRFENVTFGYSDAQANLNQMNFAIKRGQSVAFVGASGSGKSTVLNLLMRFYDPSQGRVTFDGCDIRHLQQSYLRAQMGVVFQDAFLFNTSVWENIRMGWADATDDDIVEAAKAAEVHADILDLPDGYDTIVGERGSRLSGGQRQRVAIARAILRNPSVLILDEATSALDAHTEAAINHTLARLAQDRTVIHVTHRLSSVVGLDRIFVLKDGVVVEQGHHDLLLTQGGVYTHLWHKQSGFSIADDNQYAKVSPDRLKTIPMLQDLDMRLLTRLSEHFNTEHYQKNETVIQEGEAGDKFYLIVRGEVTVSKKDANDVSIPLKFLQDGDFFGEIAMLTSRERTATVQTNTPCVFLSLGREQFLKLLESSPKLRESMEALMHDRLMEVEHVV